MPTGKAAEVQKIFAWIGCILKLAVSGTLVTSTNIASVIVLGADAKPQEVEVQWEVRKWDVFWHLDESVCEGLKILSYFHANKLTCHCFMDAGGRHETLGSKTKDFVAHGTVSSMRFLFLLSRGAMERWAQTDIVHIISLCYSWMTLSLGDSNL